MSAESSNIPEKKRKHKSHTAESHPTKKIKKSSKDKSKSSQRSLQNDGESLSIDNVTKGQSIENNVAGPLHGAYDAAEESEIESKKVDTSQEQQDAVGKQIKKKGEKKKVKSKKEGFSMAKPVSSVTEIAVRSSVKETTVNAPKPSSTPTRSWHISDHVGGRFRSIDPCFSLDERYMLIATRRSLNVYSLSSSLLVRRISISNSQTILDLKLSKSNPDLVFVVTSDGTISLWHWLEGTEVASVNYGCQIFAFSLTADETPDVDVLYLLVKSKEKENAQSHIASVAFEHRQTADTQASLEQLSATYKDLSKIQVLHQGRVIFATSETTLLIGFAPKQKKEHIWKVIAFPEGLTCFDARHFAQPIQTKDSKTVIRPNTFSIAIGSTQGVIYVYDDIIGVVLDPKKTLRPRRLHWHRNPVGALKWSLDGNYLISGGQETVLVIWQMETNRQQELPHLTSDIQRITVSPSGTSYGLQLADNSIMVISTSELAPKATMSSIQSKCSVNLNKWIEKDLQGLQTVAIENRNSPNQILITVPACADTLPTGQAPHTPFLQTFDISLGRHVSRQALARNNTVNPKKGPKGIPITEPNVYLMQTSADGLWLATAEEWSPLTTDYTRLLDTGDNEALQKEIDHRRETYIKFWKWDIEQQQWGLHARVDSPHRSEFEPHFNRILDLAANPDKTGFVSIGEDGMLRMWKPKTRLRDGKIVRGTHQNGLTTWACSKTIEIEKIHSETMVGEYELLYDVLKNAKLSFSADGSVLAVSKDSHEGLIHFFNSDTAELKMTYKHLYNKYLDGMQLLGRYIIILADKLHVWDVVSYRFVFSYDLYQDARPNSRLNLLTVNEKLGTFAVSFTKVKDADVSTRIVVFDPCSPQPLLVKDLPGVVTSLIASSSTSGFIAIDAEAEARLIQPITSQTVLPHLVSQATDVTEQEDQIMDDVDDDSDVDGVEDANPDALAESDDESDVDMDRPVVRGNQLAQLFEGSTSHALPPVQDLFHAVAKLYIGKTGVK